MILNSSYGNPYYNYLSFKPSPFYVVQRQLGETKTLEAMPSHRHSVTIPLRRSDHPILARLHVEPSLRVMIFCACDNLGRQDIAFPYPSEIKVNGHEVKANLHGLNNKPGSTSPVDITEDLRFNISYVNNVEIAYALTNKKFYFLIYVVKKVEVEDMVKKLEAGKRIVKETIVNDIIVKATDADIAIYSMVLSLKCPVSALRIVLPCRSTSCKHNQCFDAKSYFQLQEICPTWLCPICSNPAPLESLAVDEYMIDILKNTKHSTNQVIIKANGEWSQKGTIKFLSHINGQSFPSDDNRLLGSVGGKRLATEVIDLTYGDGEDGESRPTNRPFIGTNYGVPFTDSAYASLPHLGPSQDVPSSLEKPQCPAKIGPSTTTEDIDRGDTKTVYSAATTIGLTRTQNYITDLCSDIYCEIRQYFDAKLWSTISRALPGLIKAFAIKIGYDSSAQVNREIMYFIHKRHEDIIAQLGAMFRQEDEDGPRSPETGSEGMSLLDKMSMWDSKAGKSHSVIELDDLYQGVNSDEDEDEAIDGVNLPIYHGTILDSAAYNWFLASLRKESFLQWSATQPRVMTESIHQRILDKLPTGTISKQRALCGHEIQFELQWEDIIERRLEDELFERLIRPGFSFAEFITVTGSLEEAQALTIKQYMSQTWPSNGLQLLDVLQKTITDYNHNYNLILPDNTQIEAKIDGSHLVITTIGPAHFIAECGEQLAWLRAALLRNSRHFVGYCTPSITSYGVDRMPSPSEKLKYKGHCNIGFTIAHLVDSGYSIPRVQNCWQDLVGESIIIRGFPILRRPEAYPGLELSFDTLLYFLKADEAIITDGVVLVKGLEKTLQLKQHKDNVFLWHPLHIPDEVCSCCMNHYIGISVGMPYDPIDLHSLHAGRHILSNCADLQTATDDMDTDRLFKKPEVTETIFADNLKDSSHNETTVNQNESHSVFHACQNDEAVSSLSVPSGRTHSISEDGLSRFHTEYPERISLSDDLNILAADSQSIVKTGSPDDSFDSDALSISDSSEQVEQLDSNELVYSVLNNLLQELLSGFRSSPRCQQAPSENREGSVMQAGATGSSPILDTSRQCHKRNRDPEDDDDDAEQEGFLRPPRKKINPSQGKVLQSLACPYLKLDPIKHRNCCVKRLSRIRDVKQHLARRHTPDRYCQRCLETNFEDEQSLQRHVDLGNCLSKDPVILDGISYQQQRQLSRKSNPKLSEENQWFTIWEILFPGLLRPISAYLDASLSMDMCLFRAYCSRHGPALLREQLESNPVWLGSEITVEQRGVYLDRVIAQGINSLFEGYLHSNLSSDSQANRSASSSRQNENNQQSTRVAILTGSIADSGVALGSQLSSRETTSQSDILEFSYQPAAVDDQVQGASTIPESATESFQAHGQNLDMPLDVFFEEQLYGSGMSTFDSVQDFDTY